jgi:hypothetical protein
VIRRAVLLVLAVAALVFVTAAGGDGDHCDATTDNAGR